MNFSENKENQQKSIAKLKDIADNFDDYDAVFAVAMSNKKNSVAFISSGNPVLVVTIAENSVQDLKDKIDKYPSSVQTATGLMAIRNIASQGLGSSSLDDLMKQFCGDDDE